MIRPARPAPRLASSRQYAQACLVIAKVPLRWTAMTASKSSSVIENSILSRKMPALLTTTSRWPKVVAARAISFSVAPQSVTDE
jgi:hypothetical protein